MSNQIIDPEEVLRVVRRIVSTRYAVIEHRHDAADIDGLSSGGGGGGSDTAWGDITGTIDSQADLQAALGTMDRWREDFAFPIAVTAQNTATTIVCPATTGVIWRVTAWYYVAP